MVLFFQIILGMEWLMNWSRKMLILVSYLITFSAQCLNWNVFNCSCHWFLCNSGKRFGDRLPASNYNHLPQILYQKPIGRKNKLLCLFWTIEIYFLDCHCNFCNFNTSISVFCNTVSISYWIPNWHFHNEFPNFHSKLSFYK